MARYSTLEELIAARSLGPRFVETYGRPVEVYAQEYAYLLPDLLLNVANDLGVPGRLEDGVLVVAD